MTMAAIALALLAAAPATPAASDEEVWALARKVNSAPAYEAYLLRFPLGKHRGKAVKSFYRVQDLPVAKGPWEPPSPRPSGVIVEPSTNPDTCTPLLVAQLLKTVDSEEAREYSAVRTANRPAGFQAYIAKYPGGACTSRLAFTLRIRREASGRFKPIAGFGPLAPHRLLPMMYTVDDYPARAQRNRESGRVVVSYEVAEDGFAEGCRIAQSSGSALLDETSCRLLAARTRYDPARNRAGIPVRSTDSQVFDWVLPPG